MKKDIQAKTDLAQAANDALKVIANAAAEALRVTKAAGSDDHDLIIEIKTIQTTMLGEIREIKDGTSKRIGDLENEKLNISESNSYRVIAEKIHEDHENRIRGNETNITRIMTWGSAALILVGILEFIISKWGILK